MTRVLILTDSTAQFTRNDFPGWELISFAPFAQGSSPGSNHLPPSPQDFRRIYARLAGACDAIVVLTLSAHLSPVASHALSAARNPACPVPVEVLDTRTTSFGLGWAVEIAAGEAAAGARVDEIIHRVRSALPNIYTLFFIPRLTQLAEAGHLSHAQALVAGILGMLPIFLLEDGRLALLEKAHSQRGVLEYLAEFLDEFTSPEQVALMTGSQQAMPRLNTLRQHIREMHPQANFLEHTLNPQLEEMLGPGILGLAIMQRG